MTTRELRSGIISRCSRKRQDQVAVAVDGGGLAGEDERGGVELIDDGRAADRVPRQQGVAPETGAAS
jgi:hypothetical protein